MKRGILCVRPYDIIVINSCFLLHIESITLIPRRIFTGGYLLTKRKNILGGIYIYHL